MGSSIHAQPDAAPGAGDPFLVLDSSLSVCAVSAAAEGLLATRETGAVNRHMSATLLVAADAEAAGPANLAVAVTSAALRRRCAGGGRPAHEHVRRAAEGVSPAAGLRLPRSSFSTDTLVVYTLAVVNRDARRLHARRRRLDAGPAPGKADLFTVASLPTGPPPSVARPRSRCMEACVPCKGLARPP